MLFRHSNSRPEFISVRLVCAKAKLPIDVTLASHTPSAAVKHIYVS